MSSISQINANQKIYNLKVDNQTKKSDITASNNEFQSVSEAVYPSGELLRSMTGIKEKHNKEFKADSKKLFSSSNEEIKKYLYSLPVTGQVIRAYEQDEGGRNAVCGLVNRMAEHGTETSNVQLLIDLVESKKVNYSALLYLCNQGIMSDDFEKDLDLLYDAHINGKDVQEAFVPTLKSQEDSSYCREIGDVFSVEGQDNIFIKTGEDENKQLKITKNTYLKLFPPLERFAMYQGDAGNCYMLSALDVINSNPKTREKLLSCFEENGDELNVSLPGSEYVFTMNKNKMPDEIKDFKEQYSMGARGFKILEHVYGKDVQYHLTKDAHEILQDQSQNAKGIFTKLMFKKQLKEFEKALSENPDNIAIDRKMSDQSVSWNESVGVEWSKLSDISSKFTRASDYYRGKGGHEEWVFQRFGMNNIDKIFDLGTANSDKAQELLFSPDNKEQFVFTAFSNGNDRDANEFGLTDKEHGIYTRHSYSVKPKVDKNGNNILHVSNPWNSTQSSVMSYEEFQKLFTVLVAVKI